MLPLELCVSGSECVSSLQKETSCTTPFAFSEKWSLFFKEQEPSLKSRISQHSYSSMRSADGL